MPISMREYRERVVRLIQCIPEEKRMEKLFEFHIIYVPLMDRKCNQYLANAGIRTFGHLVQFILVADSVHTAPEELFEIDNIDPAAVHDILELITMMGTIEIKLYDVPISNKGGDKQASISMREYSRIITHLMECIPYDTLAELPIGYFPLQNTGWNKRLQNAGISTIGELLHLMRRDEKQIFRIRGLARKARDEIVKVRPRSGHRPLYARRGGLRGAGANSTESKIAANIERGF